MKKRTVISSFFVFATLLLVGVAFAVDTDFVLYFVDYFGFTSIRVSENESDTSTNVFVIPPVSVDDFSAKNISAEAVCDGKRVQGTVFEKLTVNSKTIYGSNLGCVAEPDAIAVDFIAPDGSIDRRYPIGDEADFENIAPSTAQIATPEPKTDMPAVEPTPTPSATPAPLVSGENSNLSYVLSKVDPAYADALEALRDGDPIANGTQSDTVRTVQTFLNEFGFNLPLTGGFYNQSLASLQKVEETFGMEKTTAVDADTFEQLLLALLYYRGAKKEITDGEEFPDTPSLEEIGLNLEFEGGYSRHAYLSGCGYEMAEAYYRAYMEFDDSNESDAAARKEKCSQPWPANGEYYRAPGFYGSNTSLNILFLDKDPDIAAVIKFYRNGENVSNLFLGRGNSVTAYLAGNSEYQIKMGYGEDWFGYEDTFGGFGSYEAFLFGDGSKTAYLEAGASYTLRINTTEIDPDSTPVGTDYTGFDEF